MLSMSDLNQVGWFIPLPRAEASRQYESMPIRYLYGGSNGSAWNSGPWKLPSYRLRTINRNCRFLHCQICYI